MSVLRCAACGEYLGDNNSLIADGPHAGFRPTDLKQYCPATLRFERVILDDEGRVIREMESDLRTWRKILGNYLRPRPGEALERDAGTSLKVAEFACGMCRAIVKAPANWVPGNCSACGKDAVAIVEHVGPVEECLGMECKREGKLELSYRPEGPMNVIPKPPDDY